MRFVSRGIQNWTEVHAVFRCILAIVFIFTLLSYEPLVAQVNPPKVTEFEVEESDVWFGWLTDEQQMMGEEEPDSTLFFETKYAFKNSPPHTGRLSVYESMNELFEEQTTEKVGRIVSSISLATKAVFSFEFEMYVASGGENDYEMVARSYSVPSAEMEEVTILNAIVVEDSNVPGFYFVDFEYHTRAGRVPVDHPIEILDLAEGEVLNYTNTPSMASGTYRSSVTIPDCNYFVMDGEKYFVLGLQYTNTGNNDYIWLNLGPVE